MRPRALTMLSTRLAAAEAGAAVGLGYGAPLAALMAPCPPIPLAASIGSDVRAVADALGLDEEVVEREVFEVCARAWRRGEVWPWARALEAYGMAAPFAEVALERAIAPTWFGKRQAPQPLCCP